jgi:hypothetical protein
LVDRDALARGNLGQLPVQGLRQPQAALSTDQCNTSMSFVRWSVKAQGFARALVELRQRGLRCEKLVDTRRFSGDRCRRLGLLPGGRSAPDSAGNQGPTARNSWRGGLSSA